MNQPITPETPAKIHVPLEPMKKPEDLAFKLSVEKHAVLAAIPLEGKPVSTGKPIARIYWGPPGSGKTSRVAGEDPNLVRICYDENGALYGIPEFKAKNDALIAVIETIQALSAETISKESTSGLILDSTLDDHLKTDLLQIVQATDSAEALKANLLKGLFAEKLTHYRDYREDSQRIRSLTLNAALENKQDVLIDITAAGKGAVYMMDTLKNLGYEIELVATLATAEIAESRINERNLTGKVLEPEDFLNKRVGCYESLDTLIEKADNFELYLNNENGKAPVKAMQGEKTMGKMHPYFLSADVKEELFATMARDVVYVGTHKPEQRKAIFAATENLYQAFEVLPTPTVTRLAGQQRVR